MLDKETRRGGEGESGILGECGGAFGGWCNRVLAEECGGGAIGGLLAGVDAMRDADAVIGAAGEI